MTDEVQVRPSARQKTAKCPTKCGFSKTHTHTQRKRERERVENETELTEITRYISGKRKCTEKQKPDEGCNIQ